MSDKNSIDNIVHEALQKPSPENLPILRKIGREQGFGCVYLRSKIWPILVGLNLPKLESTNEYSNWSNPLLKSPYYDQLRKDVDRSIAYLDNFKNCKEDFIAKQRQKLFEILEAIMTRQKELKYYQGYHDIATLFLLLFGLNAGYHMSQRKKILQNINLISLHINKDALVHPLETTVFVQLELITTLIALEDVTLGRFVGKELSSLFIPWVLTWFAHSITNLEKIARIYDYLFSAEPYSIVYVCAAFIIGTREQLLEAVKEEAEGAEIGTIYMFYQNIKNLKFDLELILKIAWKLEIKYPFEQLLHKIEGKFPEDSIMNVNFFNTLLPYRQELQSLGSPKKGSNNKDGSTPEKNNSAKHIGKNNEKQQDTANLFKTSMLGKILSYRFQIIGASVLIIGVATGVILKRLKM